MLQTLFLIQIPNQNLILSNKTGKQFLSVARYQQRQTLISFCLAFWLVSLWVSSYSSFSYAFAARVRMVNGVAFRLKLRSHRLPLLVLIRMFRRPQPKLSLVSKRSRLTRLQSRWSMLNKHLETTPTTFRHSTLNKMLLIMSPAPQLALTIKVTLIWDTSTRKPQEISCRQRKFP